MRTQPFIINVQNISGNDLETILLDFKNPDFFKNKDLKFSCGNDCISVDFFLKYIYENKVTISRIKIVSSHINQKHQQYCIVRETEKMQEHRNITKEKTDIVLNNEIYIKTGYFFKDAIITILFYPK